MVFLIRVKGLLIFKLLIYSHVICDAAIVKCVDASGRVEYREGACSAQSSSMKSFTIKDASSVSTARGSSKEEKSFSGETISSLEFEKIELISVLQLLADFANKNFAHSLTSRKIISVAYSKSNPTPWDQIVDELSIQNKFDYRITDTSIIVKPESNIRPDIISLGMQNIPLTHLLEVVADLANKKMIFSRPNSDDVRISFSSYRKSWKEVLKVLSETYAFKYRISGHSIIIE